MGLALGIGTVRIGHLEGSPTALEALDGSFNKSDEVLAMMEVTIEAAITNDTSRTCRRWLVKTHVHVRDIGQNCSWCVKKKIMQQDMSTTVSIKTAGMEYSTVSPFQQDS